MDLCPPQSSDCLNSNSLRVINNGKSKIRSSNRESCPQLPIELWIRIIGLITDSRYIPRIWLDFRRVSWSFKTATELAFCDRHLRNTEITFRDRDLDLRLRNDGQAQSTVHNHGVGHGPYLKFTLEYQGLSSQDRQRAIFRRKPLSEETGKAWLPEYGCTLTDLDAVRWRRMVQSYCRAAQPAARAKHDQHREPSTPPNAPANAKDAQPGKFKDPAHVLTTRRVANDTALPGFMAHESESGDDCISLLWQPMLSQLFGEEEYIKWAKKVDYQHSSMRQSMNAISAMVRSGDLPLDEFFKIMSDFTTKNSRRVLDTVRRERVKRQREAAKPRTHSGPIDAADAEEERIFHDMGLDHVDELDVIERARDSVFWAEFVDEWRFPGSEENEGNYYDGTGRLFQGNTETNKPEDNVVRMEDCEVPGASWYAGSDCSEEDIDMVW